MTDQVKSDADIQFDIYRRLLHDEILACPAGHPMRAQLLRDYERLHEQKFGTAVPVRSGGANFNSATGVRADVVQRDGSGGYRLSQMPKEEKK